MAVIPRRGKPYPEAVQSELDQFAAEWPGRDFWYVAGTGLLGLDSWSSKPGTDNSADIVNFSPGAMRAALEEASDG